MLNITENKINRKRAYSQNLIQRAFLDLSRTKSIDKITVTDVCRVADINRSTFYSNYEDIYALGQSMEFNLYQKLDAIMAQHDCMERESFYKTLLYIIQENATLCLFILRRSKREFKAMEFELGFPIKAYNWWIQKNEQSEFNITMEYLMWGTGVVIAKWLRRGMNPPVEVLAKQLCEIDDRITKINKSQKDLRKASA